MVFLNISLTTKTTAITGALVHPVAAPRVLVVDAPQSVAITTRETKRVDQIDGIRLAGGTERTAPVGIESWVAKVGISELF